ncbi:MAG: HEAT repeat domain-containing protein [Leptolyngbyaceae cyanobacterium]
MARSRKLEDVLDSLRSVRNDLTSDAAIATLQQVLQSKFSIAVAQAAKLVGNADLFALQPDLVSAFDRFMQKPAETDPGCKAKEYIADTLYRLEFSDERLFLQGIRHIQMEATWGKKVDTAAGLRGVCALGLVRMHYPDVMVELADLLADVDPVARVNAAKAIAYTENREGIPLLRLKVHMGDDSPQVLSECFLGLLRLDPERSLSFASRFLEKCPEPFQEATTLALGESRLEAALPILQQFWERSRQPDLRRVSLMAMAMLRHDAAIAFLLLLIVEGTQSDAQDALLALKLYQHEPPLWQRVQQAVEQRNDNTLTL